MLIVEVYWKLIIIKTIPCLWASKVSKAEKVRIWTVLSLWAAVVSLDRKEDLIDLVFRGIRSRLRKCSLVWWVCWVMEKKRDLSQNHLKRDRKRWISLWKSNIRMNRRRKRRFCSSIIRSSRRNRRMCSSIFERKR